MGEVGMAAAGYLNLAIDSSGGQSAKPTATPLSSGELSSCHGISAKVCV